MVAETPTPTDGSEVVEGLAIKLWLEWRSWQDGTSALDEWRRKAARINDERLVLAIAWADMGEQQRECWYAVARRAIDAAATQFATASSSEAGRG